MNPDLFLNKKIFDTDVEQVPIRKGFGQGLLHAGEKNDKVIGLCADLTESTQMHIFKEKFPERFIEVGVAEQNLATVASGMAAMGMLPVITSYAMFSPGRNWEQIRTTIAYNNRPVIIAGSHAGVSVGPDGGTHQAIEDIALMRVLPRMTVISPCDHIEARKAIMAAVGLKSPVYIRLAREKTPVMTTDATPFEIGKAELFFGNEGKADVGIVATGALVHKALQVAREYGAKGKLVKVLNLHTIKPIDEVALVQLAKDCGAIVTVEEHQIMAGMGSAVAEVLSQKQPVPIEFVAVQDHFGQSGTPDELIEHYGLGMAGIVKALERVLQRKEK